MSVNATSPTLSDTQFNALRKIIYERSGIHFPDGKKYVLESRLAHRLGELEMDDFEQYVSLLSMGPYQSDEFQEMFNRITINETSFFRNEPQLDVFERQVLPELIDARKSSKRLRIWSAACSTGEEPYTLAILLHRTLGVRLADWKIEILGTDISERALEVANTGRYTEYAMRTTAPMVRQRYFRQDEPYMVLSDTIREMVSFELLNLKDRAAARRHGTWDAIFCRNVMIYFDDQMKNDLIKNFSEVLSDDGYLLIGHSENIRFPGCPFESVLSPQAFAYRKLMAAKKAA
jgi:chemotaxis protein methyltransferase CheR